jgi:hypothetical protein
MGRPRTAKYPKPEESFSAKPEAAKAVSKADAVRAALADGIESPSDIAAFIKSRYGIEMARQMISSYKAQLRKRDAERAPQSKQIVIVAKPAAKSESDLLGALEAIKPLVDQYGADKVKRIVDLMG